MRENILITEGKFDSELLKKVLPTATLTKIKTIEGMGATSALSLARSYSAKGNSKILIVIDTDTFDENLIDEKKNYSENLIKMISSDSEIKLVLFVPEMDSLLFVDKHFIENYFSVAMSDLEFSLYQRDPKFAYVKLSKGKSVEQVRVHILEKIDTALVQKIQNEPKIIEIIDFFN